MGLQASDEANRLEKRPGGEFKYFQNFSHISKFSLRPLFTRVSVDYSKMEAARQIDRQLEKIESSLQENREILKQIRANIHEAELGRLDTKINSSVDRDASKYYDSIRLKDNLFYSKHSLPNCVNPSSLTSGDVNMARVYEELPFDDPDGGVWKQGWEVKAPPEEFAVEKQAKLKVFVVPHSHNDPGWIKTFDAYFREQTKAILTNAVEQMSKNKEMR